MQYDFIRWDERERCGLLFQDERMWQTPLLRQENHNPLLFFTYPKLQRKDIVLFLEYYLLLICGKNANLARWELDTLMLPSPLFCEKRFDLISPTPTYLSDYIEVMGHLFLASYIDFGIDCDKHDTLKIDFPSNLSYLKEDKYQAWSYFREHFFFENRFLIEKCSLPLSWDNPKSWDSLSFWIAITPKGEKYFTQILAPKFYERYKDLKIQIKENGEIVWSGEIDPAEGKNGK